MLVWNGTGFAPLGIPRMSGGPLTLAALSPTHGAVEVPPRSLCLFPTFGLADWSREAVHFVRASRDVYGDFQSLHVRLEFVPMFWEDRLEQLWSPVGRSFTVGEFFQQEREVVFRAGTVASSDAEGRQNGFRIVIQDGRMVDFGKWHGSG